MIRDQTEHFDYQVRTQIYLVIAQLVYLWEQGRVLNVILFTLSLIMYTPVSCLSGTVVVLIKKFLFYKVSYPIRSLYVTETGLEFFGLGTRGGVSVFGYPPSETIRFTPNLESGTNTVTDPRKHVGRWTCLHVTPGRCRDSGRNSRYQ